MACDDFHRKKKERTNKALKERAATWLICCEGECTEPNYIKGLLNWLKIEGCSIPKLDIKGYGKNTLSLYKTAQDLLNDIQRQKARGIIYEKAYIVMDKDDFLPKYYNDAISIAIERGIIPIWSNESFELWLVLHFNYHQAAIKRNEYNSKLDELLGFKYDKTEADIFETFIKIPNGLKNAIKNAKKLRKSSNLRHSYYERNPSTEMDKLVLDIMKECCYILK